MSRISLTKQELYEIYQSNIKMCEVQIEMVKRTANQIIGELYWHKQKNSKNSRINNWEIELKAAQRLYIFLIGNWFELRLYKVLHENSIEAFSECELQEINNQRSIKQKWEKAFELAISHIENSDKWRMTTLQSVRNIFKSNFLTEVDKVVTIRNHLAHGQCDTQLNFRKDKIEIPELINEDLNIQQLIEFYNKLKLIAEFLESFVVYKNKNSVNFEKKVSDNIVKIDNIDSRIRSKNFDKYIKQCVYKYDSSLGTR